MSKIAIADSIRRSQDATALACTEVGKHKLASKFLNAVTDSCKNVYDKGVVATLLNNYAKVCDSELGNSFATTHASDFGPYVMETWPLVTAWYPDFPLKDLVSVQPMDKPLAYLFFSQLSTATKKGGTSVGDVVETALGTRVIDGTYPTGEVMGENILDTQITAEGTILAYAPLNVATIPGYLSKTLVTIKNINYQAYNTASGKVLFKSGTAEVPASELSLDITTGALTGTLVTEAQGSTGATAIVANYVWNLDYADTSNIQRVKEQVEMRPLEAVPRALALEWTIFSEYLKKSQFGIEIREDNTKRILNLLYQYQVRYILSEMYTYRDTTTNPDVDININTSTAVSLEVANQAVQTQLKNVAAKILVSTGRMEGNRIVCGLNFKNWLEALPSTMFTPTKTDGSFLNSPREIGTYGTFKVYYDPNLGNDKAFMTYRGNEFYDAAYYVGEYMPLVSTDMVTLGVTTRSSFVSMEAYRYDKPQAVIGMIVTIK